MKRILIFGTFLVLLFGVRAYAQSDHSQTKVMILGTTHLQQLGSSFKAEMLDEVISRLTDYDFDAICIENMPGQLLYDIQSRNDSAFIDVLEGFGGERLKIAERYQSILGINYLAANEHANTILEQVKIEDSDRVDLIYNLVSATDLASAVIQYKYLTDKLLLADRDLKERLEKLSTSANEKYSLACRLAIREGIQKLEYIDNFQDEALLMEHFPEFMEDYMQNQEKLANISVQPVYQRLGVETKRSIEESNLLELYQFVNSKEYMVQDADAQWDIWLRTDFPSRTDRSRYYLWEMRNLQIAANIMQTAAFYPGKRVLVIIGSSHKAFLEKYLSQASDIKLLEFK